MKVPVLGLYFRQLCLGLIALSLSSCITSAHPAGIASSSAPVSLRYTSLGPAEDTSCYYQFLFLPLSGKEPTHEIIDGLVKEKGADALVGLTVEYRSSVFMLPILASECTIVNGIAVKNVR